MKSFILTVAKSQSVTVMTLAVLGLLSIIAAVPKSLVSVCTFFKYVRERFFVTFF